MLNWKDKDLSLEDLKDKFLLIGSTIMLMEHSSQVERSKSYIMDHSIQELKLLRIKDQDLAKALLEPIVCLNLKINYARLQKFLVFSVIYHTIKAIKSFYKFASMIKFAYLREIFQLETTTSKRTSLTNSSFNSVIRKNPTWISLRAPSIVAKTKGLSHPNPHKTKM